MTSQQRTRPWRVFFGLPTIPFWGVHLMAIIGVAVTGWSWTGLGWAAALYGARMFFVTAAYHRYFAHRAFKTSRWFQFLLAIGASTSAQKGLLWWAAHHRHHHKTSDAPDDIHSPVQSGFWWAHLGWILVPDNDRTRTELIRDFARFPELRWINRLHLLPPIALAVAAFFIGGFYGLTWAFFVSTVLLWHGTFTINSLTHVIGRRRYQTGDDSRNHWLLAIITLGEGWHNNHHYYQSSAHQGFRWYEVDVTYYLLRLLASVRLVRDLRVAPRHVVLGIPKPGRHGSASTKATDQASAARAA